MQKTSNSKWKYPDFIPEICIMKSPMQIQKGVPDNSTEVTTWKKGIVCTCIRSFFFTCLAQADRYKREVEGNVPCGEICLAKSIVFLWTLLLYHLWCCPKELLQVTYLQLQTTKKQTKPECHTSAPKGAFSFPQAITPTPPSHPHYQFNSSSLCFSYYQIKKNILQMLLHTAQNSLQCTRMLVNGFLRYQITWLWFSA